MDASSMLSRWITFSRWPAGVATQPQRVCDRARADQRDLGQEYRTARSRLGHAGDAHPWSECS
jgi:hypothetical protein